MQAAGVPIVPGYQGRGVQLNALAVNALAVNALAEAAEKIGYPVLVKAAAGGGGKGMRVVRSSDELAEAFGDDSVFLEKYIESPRHIEFQVLADSFGDTVHLFERECSIQRRHQKIIEETPSPFLGGLVGADLRVGPGERIGPGEHIGRGEHTGSPLREKMGAAAVAAARAVGYVNAGTVEFIVAPDGAFYFLEVNTRLQVEHPITEMVTGVDLVKAQIRIAAGERLWFTQADLSQRGHAIECRVYAEDPANNFFPSIGKIEQAIEPTRPGLRVDTGVTSGDEVTIHYDPMIAKVIAHAETRAEAIRKMDMALADYKLVGDLTTNISFLRAVIAHPAFARGETTTHFIEQHMANWQPPEPMPDTSLSSPPSSFDPWERADGFRLGMGMTGGRQKAEGRRQKQAKRASASRAGGNETLEAAMPGLVRGVLVKEGDTVERGQALVLLEAMKMEIRVAAPHEGRVVKVLVAAGETVDRGQRLIELGH
jgi:acetyl/propionyl-CoA carboxylase alpha subunit